MSYPLALDEVPQSTLLAEVDRRIRDRKAGRCDYCHRPHATPPCKFPDRHRGDAA